MTHRLRAFGLALALAAIAVSAHAQDSGKKTAPKAKAPATPAAGQLPFNIALPPTRPQEKIVPNTVAETISPEARANFVSSMMAMNPFSLREMVAMMVTKYPAKEGLSFDDVVEAMRLKGNEINFKLVGHNPLWKDIVAISGKTDTPRVEFFSFCDAMVAREILDLSLEFSAFLPCRVAVVEDANKKIWLMTLDWDVKWLDASPNPNQITKSLHAKAIQVREAIDKIMRAGAEGAF